MSIGVDGGCATLNISKATSSRCVTPDCIDAARTATAALAALISTLDALHSKKSANTKQVVNMTSWYLAGSRHNYPNTTLQGALQ